MKINKGESMKLIILVGMMFLLGCGYKYSDGERTGYIMKFSKKGFISKTWEGTMRIGGMQNGSGSMVAEEWNFSVADESVVEPIRAVMKSGEKVTLHYNENLYFFNFNGDTNHFVNRVEK